MSNNRDLDKLYIKQSALVQYGLPVRSVPYKQQRV